MHTVNINIKNLNKNIKNILIKHSIFPKKIKIIAVSKNQSSTKIKHAILSGQYDFGENYVQEGIHKIKKLTTYKNIVWHFIGKLQSNKAKKVAKYFSWCQSIDREKIAFLLNKYRPSNLLPINVLIQINISNESNKNGIDSKHCLRLAKNIVLMPNINLRGIMVLPSNSKNIIERKSDYQKINIIFNALQKKYKSVDTLSLGTSFDIEEALIYNSNMIRIGRSIFTY